MTREEYLQCLKNNLNALTIDEQNEAIQYYSDYFDDADNDEKIMQELGTPEELAKVIVEKMANGLVSKDEPSQSFNDDDVIVEDDNSSGVNFYSFNKDDVQDINIMLGAAEVVVISGNSYAVETRGMTSDSLSVSLSSQGMLTIANNKNINLNLFSHDRKNHIVPRILITLPCNANLNSIKVSFGAGSLIFKSEAVNYVKGSFEVGAGNLIIKNINGGSTNLRCGMGNLQAEGELTGRINLDCGMGSIKLNIKGDENDYSYDGKVGFGELKINGNKKAAFGKYEDSNKKQNHISVNCGMGSVNIKIEK